MSGLIPQDFIEDLLSRTDIVEVIGARVDLRKTGQNYVGLCPFHNEKSPSFSVSADKQFYYCFGCQESGNALRFVMEFDNQDFITAVESLAGNLGIEVPRTEKNRTKAENERQARQKSLYEILSQASDYYKRQLREHGSRERVVSYLKQRGVSGLVARDYDLGYAPEAWDSLRKDMAKTSQEMQLLVESGLLVDLPEEKKTYDRFRDRVIFPIKDIRGRVVGFGGRLLGEGKPKYLNSPETPVFHKGRELYGFFEARRANRDLKSVLVVEGYMDVISLSQHGITNAVATLGTATTPEHLERLYRMVPEVIFCFDGDAAGTKAAWKALEETLPMLRDGRLARFLFLPDGEDPDTIIRKAGAEKFKRLMDQSAYLPDFFFEKLIAEVNMDSFEGKAALSKRAMKLMNQIPKGVFKQLMIDRLSELTGISSERLPELTGTENKPEPALPSSEGLQSKTAVKEASASAEAILEPALKLLLKQPELAGSVDREAYEGLLALSECRLLYDIVEKINNYPDFGPQELLSSFESSPQYPVLEKLAKAEVLLPLDAWLSEYVGILEKLRERLAKEASKQVRNDYLKNPTASEAQLAYRNLHSRKL